MVHSLVLGGSLALSTPALIEGNPHRRNNIFNNCKAYHVVNHEKNRAGPHLVGLFDRTFNLVEGFKYCKEMKGEDIIWSDATLSGYLANPKQYAKANLISLAGAKKQQGRRYLMIYLKQSTAKKEANTRRIRRWPSGRSCLKSVSLPRER